MTELSSRLKQTIICFHKFGTETVNKKADFVFKWILINYIYIRLKKLFKTKLRYKCLPNKTFHYTLEQIKELDYYIDYNACIFVSSKYQEKPGWYYICSINSKRKYKVHVIPIENVPEDVVYLTETMLFNINNYLRVTEKSYIFFFLRKYIFFIIQ